MTYRKQRFADEVREWIDNPRTQPHRRTKAALYLLGNTTTDEMIQYMWDKHRAEIDTDEEDEDDSDTHASTESSPPSAEQRGEHKDSTLYAKIFELVRQQTKTFSEEIAELKRLIQALTTLVVSQHKLSEARWEEIWQRSRVESDEVSRQAEEKKAMPANSIQ